MLTTDSVQSNHVVDGGFRAVLKNSSLRRIGKTNKRLRIAVVDKYDSSQDIEMILSDLNLEIKGGEFIALLGRNGSGKTSLLKLLSGIIEPASGSVEYNHKDLRSIGLKERARLISYLPQESELNLQMGIEEYLELHRFTEFGLWGGFSEIEREKAATLLKELFLDISLKSRLGDLSSGERLKVRLVGSIIQNTKLLLLDEPFSFLDPESCCAAFGILRRLVNQDRKTVMMSWHQPDLAQSVADKILILDRGRILAFGACDEISVKEGLERTYGTTLNWYRYSEK